MERRERTIGGEGRRRRRRRRGRGRGREENDWCRDVEEDRRERDIRDE